MSQHNLNPSAETLVEQAEPRIAWHAARVRRELGLAHEDQEDLQQEMSLALFRAVLRFDASKGNLETFIEQVLNQCAREITRNAMGDQDSQFEPLEPECEPMVNDVAMGEVDEVGLIDMRLDIEYVLATLPDEIKDIGFALLSESPSEVRLRLGLGKRFFDNALIQLRNAFIEADMAPEDILNSTAHGAAEAGRTSLATTRGEETYQVSTDIDSRAHEGGPEPCGRWTYAPSGRFV